MNEKNKKILGGFILVCIFGFTGYGIYASVTDTVFLSFGNKWIYTDSQGREVEVLTTPERIISMAPSITEILFAIGANDILVGRTDFCNYPNEALDIESIGGFSTPDLEKLVSLAPDLIISPTFNAESTATLEALNLTIVIVEPGSTIMNVINSIRDIGKLSGYTKEGNDFADQLTDSYNLIVDKTSTISATDKMTCYFEIWESPMVVGNESFLNDMIDKAGGINIFADINEEYPMVSNENIISGNPDAIFITEHSAPFYSQIISNRTGYSSINAIKNNRIYSVNDDIFLRGGPRIIQALENMTKYLYPNLL
ncbi:Cobalamin-binding protein [Candidatus Lokiarchaeum ossiferum]|uniref:Cobalamin-binding protein n=1 Tax=Candidatus Lokiarchaeum ossiferum TaxID=2951803 RepID=A0ABY6HYI0_9ARCH|nr:Cobalamin-binding protein [Candidatus Lokiarchaeum sp. B-35]